jgi:uncharacterized Zn finger protein
MRFMSFSVHCTQCGHNNRPHASARTGVELVLTGKFDTCRKCGAQFREIVVPKRPLVMEVLMRISNSLSTKAILEDYDGRVPKAIGY